MFNKTFIYNIFLIIILVIAQVFVFNHINVLSKYQPYIYIVFVIFYPPNQNKILFLFLSFFLGLSVDFLEYTGGINAFALTFIAFNRERLIKLLAGRANYEMDNFTLNSFSFAQWTIYIVILIISHHIILLLLENFKVSDLKSVLINALYSSIITFIFVIIYKILFKNKISI